MLVSELVLGGGLSNHTLVGYCPLLLRPDLALNLVRVEAA